MTHDKMKAIKIVDELIAFYFKLGITKFEIDFCYEEKEIKISLQGECKKPPVEELEELNEFLNHPRQEEFEEYYWELVGVNDHYQELILLGALVDNGDIDISNGELRITVTRKK
ncbi:hypothetical protein [Natronincola ferrireducens]|uniref:Uncharacterized protein n=1 Tax=Natronincola ferrireducens TaxID=393762 RepID=A0A1G9H361_9FIRM|nr:hypothetical protein [Natronincola ferrireducens]SDL07406.1 hypothetical protein SAMN05660472_02574 [Natronincola ferrireducens]